MKDANSKTVALARLSALRARLAALGLDGFVVPHADEYQNEYLPASAERLRWLTGFTGSAGQTALTAARAAIFVDGRYTLQVRAEVPASLYEYCHLVEDPLDRWLTQALPAGGRVGYNPRLFTATWVDRQTAALARAGIVLVACEDDPVDALWEDRPAPPGEPVVAHALAFAGRTAKEKCAIIAAELRRTGFAAAVLAAPDSVAWLLNVRGADVANTPLPLARAIIRDDETVAWFVDADKPAAGVVEGLPDTVTVCPPSTFADALAAFAGIRVLVDPLSTSAFIVDRLRGGGARVECAADPCVAERARKNPVELAGARAAHQRDGVAMVRFLSWLETEVARRPVSESAAADRLQRFRADGLHFRGPSFDTIAGAGPNGAIVHYRVSPESDRSLDAGSLFLLDSGGQYLDGTTDVTRTVAIGQPTAEMRHHFTLVLKGHIALAQAIFPAGTTGSQLDVLARLPLWSEGLDYDHGTGHGVGSYLSVHERPQRISKLPQPTALEVGMIVSIEPGYYRTGAYGIRIENLVAVTEAEAAPGPASLRFEALTLVPFDRRLIEVEALTTAEVAWIDAYHARVAAALRDDIDSPTRQWLAAATRPLGLGER